MEYRSSVFSKIFTITHKMKVGSKIYSRLLLEKKKISCLSEREISERQFLFFLNGVVVSGLRPKIYCKGKNSDNGVP